MRRFLRHVSGVSIANIANGVLGIVFVPVAVQRLGVAGYGQFAMYSVLTSYIVLLELGLGKNLLRRLASTSASDERVRQLRLANGLYLTIAAALTVALPLIAILVPTFMFPVPAELQRAVGLIAALSVLEYILGIPSSILQTRCIADEQFERYSRYSIVTGVYRYALGFLALLITSRPEIVVAILVSRRVFDFWVARWMMGPLPPAAWTPRFDRTEFGSLIRSSSALSIAQILQVLIVSAGAILVNRSFGVQSLGLYRAVYDIASKVWFFSNTLGLVLFPKFVRLLSDRTNLPLLTRLVPSVVTFSCIGYVLLALILAGLAPPILPKIGLSDPRYEQLFGLLVAAICLNAHANFSYEFTQAAGRYRYAVLAGVIAFTCLLGTFYLARPLGPELAIGLAWLSSQIAYTLVTDASVYSILAPSWRSTAMDMTIRFVSIVCLIAGALASSLGST